MRRISDVTGTREPWTRPLGGGALPPLDATKPPDMTSMIEARLNVWKTEQFDRVRAKGVAMEHRD